MKDMIDQELLPVFLEEAKDLLAGIGDGLQKFKEQPGNTALLAALRGPIHTLKGSARMTGAMRFGRHWHMIEGVIATILKQALPAPAEVERLFGDYAQALSMFEELKQGESLHDTQSALQAGHAGYRTGDTEKKSPVLKKHVPHIRIRANLLDQFLNHAGEIAIAGAHVENGVTDLQKIINTLADNIGRMEKHVRHTEIQAEIQMRSLHLKDRVDADFDPLELDRFTQLQVLTRMMTESLAEIASLQKSLRHVVGNVREFDARRSRLTRNLQQEIMAARMVRFKSANDRLQRLIRQVSREADKEVVLDVLGGNQEVDRSVLEKMMIVIEHLLRNAIVHGIEHRLIRLNADKTAHGQLLLEMRTVGNELLIRLADDGAGMDLVRIKAQAVRCGLLKEDESVSPDNLFDVISHPGLSTSEQVTTLSGRGVGLDVVSAEIAALGGRVELETRTGQGTLFMLYLPLTLAVAQVVLVRVGEAMYAISSLSVQQVIRAHDVANAGMVDGGVYRWGETTMPVVSLARLLHLNVTTSNTHAALLLKHGKQWMAVLVDAVLGNKEVVIKPIGGQLARVSGLLGATILGTGDIVLILHPALLMQQREATHAAASPFQEEASPPGMTVMVVDDSLTVRRVLKKLLLREGYAVMLARDGMDAMMQLQKNVPDIMLVDIEMPRMDGFHLLEKIRERDDTARLPVVMITSRTAKKHQDKALALGANAYLGKPYQEEQLLALIAQLTGVASG